MTSRFYTTSRTIDRISGPVVLQSTDYGLTSGNSVKVGGKLQLRPQVLTHREDRVKHVYVQPGVYGSTPVDMAPQGASINRNSKLPPNFSWASTDNQAKARFDGKLRYGSASLGVTIASWKQSQDMIVKRLGSARYALDRTWQRLSKDPRLVRKLKREREPLAGQILETEFGWMPLIQDVKAALTTVIAHGVPDQTLRGVGQALWVSQDASPTQQDDYYWSGTSRTCYQARVAITNPHLWMLNRMGLINLPGIVWDLVPWSFVVNMFGNFNQLISGLTSYVGVEFHDLNVTRSVKMLTGVHSTVYWQTPVPPVTVTRLAYKERTRTLGTPPSVTLELRVPDINWELALIAASLVVQRVDRINKLIRVL